MKSRLRAFQERAENAGWRIKMIPFHDPDKVLRVEASWIGWISLLAVLGFVAGVLITINSTAARFASEYGLPGEHGMALAIGSWMMAMFSIVLDRFIKTRGWKLVDARCVDRELQSAQRNEWYWRVVCEFSIDGKNYRVTPLIHEMFACSSQTSAVEFLAKRVRGDAGCRLLVNPKNPLQTKLIK
jgi:hypothetical protein